MVNNEKPNINKNNNIHNIQFNLQNQNNPIFYPLKMNPFNNQMFQYQMNYYMNYYNKLNNIKQNINTLNKYSLKIDISRKELKNLSENVLIKIIQFIQTHCKIFIDDYMIDYKSPCFKIEKSQSLINECFLKIKDEIEKEIKDPKYSFNIINDETKDIKKENNSNGKGVNIKTENIKNNLFIPDKTDNNLLVKNGKWICINHKREFIFYDSYKSHYRTTHKYLCPHCGIFFGFIKKFHKHCIACKKNNLINDVNNNLNVNNNKNKEDNEKHNNYNSSKNKSNNMIKCSDCDLIFNNIESMSMHFYNIHEKKKEENKNKIEINNLPKNCNIQKKIELKREEYSLVNNIKDIISKMKINCNEKIFEKMQFKIKEEEKEKLQKNESLKNQGDVEIEEERNNQEELKMKENLKKQEELQKHEELKLNNDLKKKEEINKKIELKEEEINMKKDQEEIKEIKESKDKISKKDYYECYLDKIQFSSEKDYVSHFKNNHPEDYPFNCDICYFSEKINCHLSKHH